MQVAAPQVAPVAPAPRRSVKSYLIGGVVGLIVGALVMLSLSLTGVIGHGGASTMQEGPGYDSPEAAAFAFLDGLKAGDLDAMLAPFAIQSFAANCDYEARLVQTQSPSSSDYTSCPYPNDDPLGAAANVRARIASLSGQISMMIFTLVSPNLASLQGNVSLRIPDDTAAQAFVQKIAQDFANYPFKDLSNRQSVDPASLWDKYASDLNQQNIAAIAQIYGLTRADYADVAITFDAGGQQWVYAPSAGRYHGRWYLLMPQGNLAPALELSYVDFGLGHLH